MLGIIGGSMMIVLLLYPISKRVKLLTRLVPLRYWFGIHMTLGVLGPVLILFHSNFQLGSVNSNVALFCMLIVAGSGLIGRYIYTRIHHGLYGSKIQMKELKAELSAVHARISGETSIDDALETRLSELETKTIEPRARVLRSISHLLVLSASARSIRKQLLQSLDDRTQANQTRRVVDHYFSSLRRITTFQLYDRLFSLWHVLHLPLFIMMLITATIHIFAVHMY
jgi:hypothetical protein